MSIPKTQLACRRTSAIAPPTALLLLACTPLTCDRKTKAVLSGGGEAFVAGGTVVLKPGFTAIMPWRVGWGKLLRSAQG